MNTPLRLSPIDAALRSLHGEWHTWNQMPSLAALATDANYASRLGIVDVSCHTRFGVKGAKAAQWLAQQGLAIPDRPNSWMPLRAGGLIARLGLTEFLVEDSIHSAIAPQLTHLCQSPPAQVYPVLRQDLALVLVGDLVPELLRQTCSINFQALPLTDRPVILTSMIGVAVTIIPDKYQDNRCYRIWCDGTFGIYFWETLREIATELGGGAIGTEFLTG
jgi:sarcosine oxidase subunit gamma